MTSIRRFEDLTAWKKARKITRLIYAITESIDFNKDTSLKNQMRRAAVSIMSNIAEGFERGSDKEFQRFLNIAMGSSAELRSQLYVAYDQGYLDKRDFTMLRDEAISVNQMIGGLVRYLRNSNSKGT